MITGIITFLLVTSLGRGLASWKIIVMAMLSYNLVYTPFVFSVSAGSPES